MKKDLDSNDLHMDEEHFRLFFRENYKVACLIANRYVKNMDQSEDLVQDVFTAFWERRASVRNYQNIKNYFFAAVRNHSLNFIHRERRDKLSFSDIFREIPEDDTAVFYDKEVLAVKVLNAIDELPPQCKKIFNLAYQKDQTYQEIADQLNISKNTVKTQMAIAYKSLRLKLNSLLIIGLFFLRKIV
jgi:RNA polymerase sigma-70 factor (ECF subfamily)